MGPIVGNQVIYPLLARSRLALTTNRQQIALEGAALMESSVLSEDDECDDLSY